MQVPVSLSQSSRADLVHWQESITLFHNVYGVHNGERINNYLIDTARYDAVRQATCSKCFDQAYRRMQQQKTIAELSGTWNRFSKLRSIKQICLNLENFLEKIKNLKACPTFFKVCLGFSVWRVLVVESFCYRNFVSESFLFFVNQVSETSSVFSSARLTRRSASLEKLQLHSHRTHWIQCIYWIHRLSTGYQRMGSI